MTDDTGGRRAIASPCINVCVIDPGARICVGCYRTGDEIAGWTRYTDAQRAALMAALPARAARLGDRDARSSTARPSTGRRAPDRD